MISILKTTTFFWIITAAWRNEIIKNYLVVALMIARPSFNQQQHQQHNNEISVLLKCSTTTSTLMMVLIIMIIKWKNSGWNSNPVERISFSLWILMFIICFVYFLNIKFWISSRPHHLEFWKFIQPSQRLIIIDQYKD